MSSYFLASRGESWGIFAIFPIENCLDGDRLKNELTRFKARSKVEAEALAAARGIGVPGSIWAIEVVNNDRLGCTCDNG